MHHWISLCEAFASRNSIPTRWLDVVYTFGDTRGMHGLEASSFGSLESQLEIRWESLPRLIERILLDEIDAHQSAIFVRRLESVLDLLNSQVGHLDAGRLLRVGLLGRVIEILEGVAGLPRALRVRAVCDFYYSQVALLHHHQQRRSDSIRPWNAGLKNVTLRELLPGIHYARLPFRTPLGPQRIHLVRFRASTMEMTAVDRREQVARGIPLDTEARERGASIAISGGFFLYSEPDIREPSRRGDPVGLLMNEGRVLVPPVFRRATLFDRPEHGIGIRVLGLHGCRIRIRGRQWHIDAVNTTVDDASRTYAFNRASEVPVAPGPQMSIIGREVQAISTNRPLSIPLNGYVLRLPFGSPLPDPGTTLSLELPESMEDWQAAMAGGPMLVEDGKQVSDLRREDFYGTAPPRTFSGDETGDRNLLPRMLVGIDDERMLTVAAVEGRDFFSALGLTLEASSEMMMGLGCTHVMNLDGGSSKRLVLKGRQMDRSSTEVRGLEEESHQRPVRTALFFFDSNQ